MINYLRHMAVFARVVEEGSFRAAAKKLDVAPSRVSHTVSDLEKFLGVTLLYRTTRKLSVTTKGHKFYAHVADLMRNAEAGLNELNELSQKPVGALKISLPAFLTSSPISSAIAEFARQQPEVSLSLIYTDRVVDIFNEGLDLSIRVGISLEDSSMISRKLGESRRLLVSSTKYAESHPPPKHPTDLRDWDWVSFQMRPSTIEFCSPAGETVGISEKSHISVNSAEALCYFVSQDLGLTILPEHLAKDRLNTGEFSQVLPEWELKPLGYYAMWPEKSRRENLTLLLVRFVAERCLTSD